VSFSVGLYLIERALTDVWFFQDALTPTNRPISLHQVHLSLSRLNHRLPRRKAHPEIVQGTAEFHHEIADAVLPQPDPVFHNTTALDATVDMLDA
jgi:hypothetical protein